MCTCINTSKHLQKARTINSMRRHPKYSAYWLLVHRVLGKVRLGFTIFLFSRSCFFCSPVIFFFWSETLSFEWKDINFSECESILSSTTCEYHQLNGWVTEYIKKTSWISLHYTVYLIIFITVVIDRVMNK